MGTLTFQNMHSVSKKNNYLFIIVFIIFGCEKNNNTSSSKIMMEKCDTLIYRLSNEVSTLMDSSIDIYQPKLIYLVSNSDENSFKFSFYLEPNDLESEKENYLISKINIYLKTNKHLIMILKETDEYFSITPFKKKSYPPHSGIACFTVNANGQLLDYYIEDYKIVKKP